MAYQIQAVSTYAPRIELGTTVKEDQLINYIADRTGLNRGDVRQMLDEFQDAIVFFAHNGQGVKLEGLATFLPKINLAGQFGLSVRVSRRITNRLNEEGSFNGNILNRDNIGKTVADLVALWNAENPSDPVS